MQIGGGQISSHSLSDRGVISGVCKVALIQLTMVTEPITTSDMANHIGTM